MQINLSTILNSGKLWEKCEHKRTYINADEVIALAGYKIERYKTGNVKAAYDPEGDKISNSKAANIFCAIYNAYYDHKAGKFSVDLEGILDIEIVNDLNGEEKEEQEDAKAAKTEDKWHRVKINIQNIKHETARAVLIAMPHSSDYDGFCFWFPKKLVREGSHSYEISVSVPDDMEITISRTSEKTRKVLEEKTIGADELVEAFGRSFCTKARKSSVKTIKHTPEPLEAEEVKADASLVR